MPIIVNTLALAIQRVADLERQRHATGPSLEMCDAYHRLGLLQQKNKLYSDAVKSFQIERLDRITLCTSDHKDTFQSIIDLIDDIFLEMINANDTTDIANIIHANSYTTSHPATNVDVSKVSTQNNSEIKWVFGLHAKLLALNKFNEAIDILKYAIEICDSNLSKSDAQCDYVYLRQQARCFLNSVFFFK